MVWKYFIPFHRCLYIWLTVLLCWAEAFSLMYSPTHLFLHLLSLCLVSNPKIHHQDQRPGGLLLCFLIGFLWFQISHYKSFNLFFELIFVWCDTVVPASFFCMWLLFSAPYVKGLFFSYCILLAPLLKIKRPSMHGIISGLYSVLLIYVSVLMPITYCYDYYSHIL